MDPQVLRQWEGMRQSWKQCRTLVHSGVRLVDSEEGRAAATRMLCSSSQSPHFSNQKVTTEKKKSQMVAENETEKSCIERKK
jgi:hypothetical protein